MTFRCQKIKVHLEPSLLIALVAVGATAGGYYFKVYKPKHEYDDEDEMEEDEDESEDSESVKTGSRRCR